MPKPLRVLLVEDQENDALLLLRELDRLGYVVTWERVQTRATLVAALTLRTWDLVISDFRMPMFGAPEALRICREQAAELPFIIVSGTIGEEEAVDSMRLGAHDFVVKGRLARLGPAIERGLREYAERRALRETEARLQQAQKMEAIGQLAGGVAHDFNNLLGVVQGYGELVLRDLVPESRQWTRVNQILRAAGKGAALTRQLLAFSRQHPLAARPVDLNAVVTDIETMFRRLIGEDIQIDIVPAAELYMVKADPTQIEQVLMNLLINARDAMSTGGRIIVETSNVELDDAYTRAHPDIETGAYAMLAVTDTGHGMDNEVLRHIFEPFFTTKAPGRGTGLGLATAYGILKQSGGHIAVYSEPGHGTTFKVYLPRAQGADGSSTTSVATHPREAVDKGTETLLLVEDEEALRVVVHDLLEEGGYTVIDGPGPEASLAAAQQHPGPIHLVITDLVMPEMTGREAAARLQAARPGTKVLYMSGYTGSGAEHIGPIGPQDAFIQKPFTLDALLRKVRDVLDSQHIPDTAP